MKKKTGSKVLIINDKLYLRKQIRQILTKEGYDIVGEGNDGHDAIDLFRKHRPELLIMDMDLPLLDGIGAAEIITRRYKDAKVMLIFDNYSRNEEAKSVGVMSLLRKPIESNLLVSQLLEMERNKPPGRSVAKPIKTSGDKKKEVKITKTKQKKEALKPLQPLDANKPEKAEKNGKLGMPGLGSGNAPSGGGNRKISLRDENRNGVKQPDKPKDDLKKKKTESTGREKSKSAEDINISIPVPVKMRSLGDKRRSAIAEEPIEEIESIVEDVPEEKECPIRIKPFNKMMSFRPKKKEKKLELPKIKPFAEMNSYRLKKKETPVILPTIKPFDKVPILKKIEAIEEELMPEPNDNEPTNEDVEGVEEFEFEDIEFDLMSGADDEEEKDDAKDESEGYLDFDAMSEFEIESEPAAKEGNEKESRKSDSNSSHEYDKEPDTDTANDDSGDWDDIEFEIG